MTNRLTIGQRFALGGAIMMALALAAYGAVGSYKTVSDTATALGVPFPHLVPIGIDGGLVGVVTLDLVLAWTGHPIAWLRQLARLLTLGTVAANVSAGWPDPIAVGLHAAAPVMLLAMVEAGRSVLLRRAGLAAGTVRDRIPIGRWLLSPWRTWLLWRRMVLWQIADYHEALHMEAAIRRARTQLQIQFGPAWKREAPSDLVWMLNVAPYAREACDRVNNLANQTHPQPTTPHAPAQPTNDSDKQLDEVIKINEQHWATRNRPVSADTVREQLRIGAARARELTRTVRAMDKARIERQRPAESEPA
ncbi:DUF2637 domain-containing protein [Kibdelosporangium aridum]|uniref:DUF2637 domain-containing protein n=1 Tax=Kibdelosporangium aridum TaxID=2030 RepID=UPI00068ADA2D